VRLLPLVQNPLRERFSREFFRELPASPGVYRMLGNHGELLYVGKSRNLRARIRSYTHLKPGDAPRKILRLLHHVVRIDIEPTPSETDALLLENQILRAAKPPYNRQNTRPESYLYLGLKTIHLPDHTEMRFRITARPRREQNDELFGVFRNRGALKNAVSAFLRLLWLIQNPDERFSVPSRLLSQNCPRTYTLAVSPESPPLLTQYWEGENSEILSHMALQLLDRPDRPAPIPAFLYKSIQEDFEGLKNYFEKGPRRNRELKQTFEFKKRLIPQELIDDWLAIERSKKKAECSEQKVEDRRKPE
jgi:hypothetical protein